MTKYTFVKSFFLKTLYTATKAKFLLASYIGT